MIRTGRIAGVVSRILSVVLSVVPGSICFGQTADKPSSEKTAGSVIRTLVLPAAGGPWDFEADPATQKIDPRKIRMPGRTHTFEQLTSFVGNPVAHRFASGFYTRNPGKREEKIPVMLVLADTRSSLPVAGIRFDGVPRTPLAIHDDGERVLVRREDQLEFWKQRDSELIKDRAFDPGYKRGELVIWARFLSSDKFVTWGTRGRLAVWDFPSLTTLCEYETGNTGLPALSGGRRYVAFVAGRSVYFFDTTRDEVTHALDASGRLGAARLKFSPSGEKLACLAGNVVFRWDLNAGQFAGETPVPRRLSLNSKFAFPHDDFFLLGGHTLIEVDRGAPVWKYNGMDTNLQFSGATAVLVADRPESAILVGDIPHPPVFDALKEAASQPGDDSESTHAPDPVMGFGSSTVSVMGIQ